MPCSWPTRESSGGAARTSRSWGASGASEGGRRRGGRRRWRRRGRGGRGRSSGGGPGLCVQPIEGARGRLPYVLPVVVDRAALEGHRGIRAADLPQRDRRGDPHVLEIVIFQ